MLAAPVPSGEDGMVTTTRPPARPTTRRSLGPSWRSLLGPLVAIGALALGLAACGGTGSSTTSTAAAPTTTAAPTSTTGSQSTSSSSTSTPLTPIRSCRTASLAISLGSPNGSAGATHYGLTFQNTGTSACTLFGYPGVSFLDSSGSQIGAPAQRQPTTPATITLAAGGNAYASVSVTDPGIPPCSGSTAATKVRVYPPGETSAATVTTPSGLLVCSSPNTGSYLSSTVTPVSAAPL